MIYLLKHPKPQILIEKAVEWVREIVSKVSDGAKIGDAVGRKYAHPQIKEALLAETSDKCAYCESKVTHIAYGDIEHVIAKSVDPARAVEWENLTIACDRCNQNKSDHEGLLDPYGTDPADHLVFLGPLVRAVPASEMGELTVRVLDLNRVRLVEKRVEKIDSTLALLALAERAVDLRLKASLLADARRCGEAGEEYSAAVRQVLRTCAVE